MTITFQFRQCFLFQIQLICRLKRKFNACMWREIQCKNPHVWLSSLRYREEWKIHIKHNRNKTNVEKKMIFYFIWKLIVNTLLQMRTCRSIVVQHINHYLYFYCGNGKTYRLDLKRKKKLINGFHWCRLVSGLVLFLHCFFLFSRNFNSIQHYVERVFTTSLFICFSHWRDLNLVGHFFSSASGSIGLYWAQDIIWVVGPILPKYGVIAFWFKYDIFASTIDSSVEFFFIYLQPTVFATYNEHIHSIRHI